MQKSYINVPFVSGGLSRCIQAATYCAITDFRKSYEMKWLQLGSDAVLPLSFKCHGSYRKDAAASWRPPPCKMITPVL